jgi:hypothetical protein
MTQSGLQADSQPPLALHLMPLPQESWLHVHLPTLQTGAQLGQTTPTQRSCTGTHRLVMLHTWFAGQEPWSGPPAHLQSPSAASHASPVLQVTPWHLFVPPTHLPVQSHVWLPRQVPQ